MAGIVDLLNWAKIPNWAKLMGVGIFLGIQIAAIQHGQDDAVNKLSRKLDDQIWVATQGVAEQQALRRELLHVAIMDSMRTAGLELEVKGLQRDMQRYVKEGNEVHKELWQTVGRASWYKEIE